MREPKFVILDPPASGEESINLFCCC